MTDYRPVTMENQRNSGATFDDCSAVAYNRLIAYPFIGHTRVINI